jgi:hypothetical protein
MDRHDRRDGEAGRQVVLRAVDEVGRVAAHLLAEQAQVGPQSIRGEKAHLRTGRDQGGVRVRQRAVQIEKDLPIVRVALPCLLPQAADEGAGIRAKSAVLRVRERAGVEDDPHPAASHGSRTTARPRRRGDSKYRAVATATTGRAPSGP